MVELLPISVSFGRPEGRPSSSWGAPLKRQKGGPGDVDLKDKDMSTNAPKKKYWIKGEYVDRPYRKFGYSGKGGITRPRV